MAANSQRCSDTEKEPVVDTSNFAPFSCPEEGCVKTDQTFYSLQHHLDLDKHKRTLENETLLARAALGYADRLSSSSVVYHRYKLESILTSQVSLVYRWDGH